MGMSRCGAFQIIAAVYLTAVVAPTGRCADSPPPDGAIISVQVDPCFVGQPFGGVTPIMVTITNRGAATRAELNVHNRAAYQTSNQYHSRIDLPGDGAKSQVIMYPDSQDERWSPSPGYVIDVDVPGHSLSTQLIMPNSPGSDSRTIALLGDNFGALSTNRAVRVSGTTPENDIMQLRNAWYVKPENAPARALAYSGLSNLVLGDGADRLTTNQWSAIREWVVSGGSLILLGKSYLQLPQVEALLPVIPHAPQAAESVVLPRISDNFLLSSLPELPEKMVQGDLLPGAKPLEEARADNNAPVILARRQLGAGTVLFFGLDPTEPAFRSWSQLPKLWQTLIYQAAPIWPPASLASGIISKAPWNGDGQNRQNSPTSASSTDPFQITLPPLPSVVYVFVAYFLLAVPVSFVILKRTRRMNLAWVTGPTLAVLFGGALYISTMRLNTATLSRRTAGVLTAAAGDKTAQFSGDTELFFPRSGVYDVSVPNAESIEYVLVASPNYGDMSNGSRDLESFDDGKHVHVPELSVANLSFRRIYHTQSIDWGGGIESDLRLAAGANKNALKIVGEIKNSTGRMLKNAYLAIPGREAGSSYPVLLKITDIAPGTTNVEDHFKVQDIRAYIGEGGGSNKQYNPDVDGPYGWRNVSAPTLYACTSAADLGPSLGQYVGGNSSAQVIVSLPGLTLGGTR